MTAAGASEQIRRLGLRSTADLLTFLGVPEPRRAALTTSRRPKTESIIHPEHGAFVIGDNAPLSEARLAGRLEDGLTFPEWLQVLNNRVFFWTDRRRAESLRNSRRYRETAKELLVLDTRRLAAAHQKEMEIAPFNTGATGRQPSPPTRGRSTFSPLLTTNYGDWTRRRGKRDRIVEVVVRGAVPDISDFILSVDRL